MRQGNEAFKSSENFLNSLIFQQKLFLNFGWVFDFFVYLFFPNEKNRLVKAKEET